MHGIYSIYYILTSFVGKYQKTNKYKYSFLKRLSK